MRILFRGVVLLMLMLSLVACKKNLKPEELPAHIVVGDSYYTQFVIRYEKSAHLTTNFRRGASVPVNTKVQLQNITTKTIEVILDGLPNPLVIKNVQKHTGDDVFQAFDKYFAPKKVSLRAFNSLEKTHIKKGTVAKGMRKKAVIVAIGYPPITETMNLDADTWVYWSGRFNKFNVNFSKGKVSSVVD
ncbi:MAG: hypothetical protein KAQ91_03620 [Methylococcales bacterium]|nr:hypothetical protein [Methylococcales bacterium]